MMYLAKTTALVALLTIGTACAASAATIPLGHFGDFGEPISKHFGHDSVQGQFSDLFTFSLDSAAKVTISITNSAADTREIISPFTLSLFGTADGSGTALKTANATNSVDADGTTTQNARLSDVLGLGNFSFGVTGDTLGAPSYGGSFSLTISPVPLPASAPLFGGALLALGLAGYGVSRRKATTTA